MKVHILKEALMDELAKWEHKAEKLNGGYFTNADIDRIRLLTDTVKNIDKIEMLEGESGYSAASDWMSDSRIYGTSYRNDGQNNYSNRRGRGANARRDSMGRYASRYSYGDNKYLIDKAEEMLEMTDDPEQCKAIESFKKKLEMM